VRRTLVCIFIAYLSASHGPAAGEIALPDGFQVHGFLSQGFVKTSANRWFGDSEAGSWDFREIGLNASYQPRPNLLFSAQLLSRTAGEMYDGGVGVDYALVDYAPIMTADMRIGLRAGRLKNPLGFYNDTRDVPFTRPSVFLPQSIYFDRVRNLELSSDGVGLYGNWMTGVGELSAQVYYGQLAIDQNVEYSFIGGDFPGELGIDDPWLVWRLMYESVDGGLRLAVSQASGKMVYEPGAVDFLTGGSIDLDFTVLSAQYNTEKWTFTAEWVWEPIDYRDFNIPQLGADLDVMGWYVQAAYQVNPDWEVFVRYDRSDVNREYPVPVSPAIANFSPDHNFFAKDFTLGVRWDLTSQFMLRAEYHRVEGTVWLSPRENDMLNAEKDWDMFVLQASYRF
jgi:hypothetical protein